MSFYLNSTSSGLQTADAVVTAKPAMLTSVTLIADLTNAATVVIYDNATAASGLVLAKCNVPALGGTIQVSFNSPIQSNNGLFADVTGTGAAYIVAFCPIN